MIRHLLRKLLNWLDARDERKQIALKLKRFPPGTRVLITGECCERDAAGRHGTILGLDSYDEDYRVAVDGDTHADGTPKSYRLLCAKGFLRAVPL